MKTPSLYHWLIEFALSITLTVRAEIASEPAGFHKLTLLGNSDTIVSLPFSRPAVAIGTIDVAVSNVVQVQGSPNWTLNQFVYAAGSQSNTYYLRMDSGLLEGRQFLITSNDPGTITLNLNGASLTNVAQGNRFSVVPYWTLGTAFPGGKGVHASTSTLVRNSEILVPNYSGTGVSLGVSATYYFFTNTTTHLAAWRLVGSSSTNRNDDILQPNIYMIIRHKLASNTTYTSLGSVITWKLAIPLRVNSLNKQDNPLALTRPGPVSLNDSGLIESGGFVPSTSSLSRKDELYTFDNTTTNFSKSFSGTYYYFNSGWRKVGTPTTVNFGSSNIFLPGTGFFIRKAAGNTAPVWLNSPNY